MLNGSPRNVRIWTNEVACNVFILWWPVEVSLVCLGYEQWSDFYQLPTNYRYICAQIFQLRSINLFRAKLLRLWSRSRDQDGWPSSRENKIYIGEVDIVFSELNGHTVTVGVLKSQFIHGLFGRNLRVYVVHISWPICLKCNFEKVRNF